MKLFALAAGIVLASAGTALAAPGRATADLNLRSGPGTAYRVIDTMPAGAVVDIRGCRGAWCRVDFQGATGFAAANLLSGPAVGYARPAPAYVYGAGPGYWASDDVYDDGPDYGFAYDPGFSVGFGFGGFHHGFRHGGFHHGGFHGGGFHGGYHGGGHHH